MQRKKTQRRVRREGVERGEYLGLPRQHHARPAALSRVEDLPPQPGSPPGAPQVHPKRLIEVAKRATLGWLPVPPIEPCTAHRRAASGTTELMEIETLNHATKQRLLEVGMGMLLERGYNALGVQALLDAAEVPKGSFYHHFKSKEDFALQVIDTYMKEVHQGLDACLRDPARRPLARARSFFEATQEKYRGEGYLGCLLGGLGQELSGVNEVFRIKIEQCIDYIASRMAACLGEAQRAGDLPPTANPREMAELLVNCWEGAALRTRLRRDPAPLQAMLDFYFGRMG